MRELKIKQCITAVFGIFVALALVLSPSVAFAADTWNPHTMANTIDTGTGVDAVTVDDDGESVDRGADVVADEESDVVTSASSSQPSTIGDIMNSFVAMMIGSIIIGAILSVVGIIILLLFVVLCGTLINRIRCLCEHPSQARMYAEYTNKLILALGLTMLCEFIIVVIYLVALL